MDEWPRLYLKEADPDDAPPRASRPAALLVDRPVIDGATDTETVPIPRGARLHVQAHNNLCGVGSNVWYKEMDISVKVPTSLAAGIHLISCIPFQFCSFLSTVCAISPQVTPARHYRVVLPIRVTATDLDPEADHYLAICVQAVATRTSIYYVYSESEGVSSGTKKWKGLGTLTSVGGLKCPISIFDRQTAQVQEYQNRLAMGSLGGAGRVKVEEGHQGGAVQAHPKPQPKPDPEPRRGTKRAVDPVGSPVQPAGTVRLKASDIAAELVPRLQPMISSEVNSAFSAARGREERERMKAHSALAAAEAREQEVRQQLLAVQKRVTTLENEVSDLRVQNAVLASERDTANKKADQVLDILSGSMKGTSPSPAK